MLKSPVPVYLCSTAFSIVFLSATDRRPLIVETPANNTLYAVKETSNAATVSFDRSIVSAPNKKEMKFVRSYIRRNDQCLINVKRRSEVPFTIIDSVFNHYGLPHELKYLAVIESELKPAALSKVGARGPWQLMPATALIFGLKMNSHGDERMNYYKSTRAAARYLRDLYHQFGDWLLVLAAYNGGPGPVFHAIHKSHNRNFWALQQWLPAESREHVKKFIATDYYFNEAAGNSHLPKAQLAAPSIHAENRPKHIQESPDDKFSRLMRESANSLQKSNELLGK
jgi:hypothetical protein